MRCLFALNHPDFAFVAAIFAAFERSLQSIQLTMTFNRVRVSSMAKLETNATAPRVHS
jgi:hypothetical protein